MVVVAAALCRCKHALISSEAFLRQLSLVAPTQRKTAVWKGPLLEAK
jgi:hypothetical protein